MIIQSLRLKHFRQYYGTQELEFASGTKNVTVINGNNGAGKTNMFLAINWCLYGSEGILDNKGMIINKRAVAEISTTSKPAEAWVQLRFSHIDLSGEKSDFVAERTTREPETLRLSKVTRKGLEVLPNPTLVLNTILPRNVRHYFLFDGEKIDEFAKPEHEGQVKEAVYSVLKLEVLSRASAHLSAVGVEYERDLKKLDTGEKFQEFLTQKETLKEHLEKTREEQERAEKELKGAQQVIERLDKELAKQKEVETLVRRRKDLEQEQESVNDELDVVRQEIKEIGTSAYLLFGSQAIQKAITAIEEKRRKGEIPAGIREQFIQDLLVRKVCVCGRPLSEGTAECETLLGLLRHSLPSKIENIVLETSGLLHKLKAKGEQFYRGLKALKVRKAKYEERLTPILKELDDISERLTGAGIQVIEVLESKRKVAQKHVEDFLLQIGQCKQRCSDLQEDIDELDGHIEKAGGLQGRAKLIQRKLTLANESAKAVNEVHERFAKEMRTKIQEETQRIFASLVWKESQFTKVDLTDDYKLQVLDRWGAPARPELSAGERQLLSLSFITALSQASEGSAPMVMDTPFGRLDTAPRERISQVIPLLVDQLVLFVTGTELQGKARDLLRPFIGKEYRLDWDKTTGCTSIINGGRSEL